jgi:hypothetical protein
MVTDNGLPFYKEGVITHCMLQDDGTVKYAFNGSAHLYDRNCFKLLADADENSLHDTVLLLFRDKEI